MPRSKKTYSIISCTDADEGESPLVVDGYDTLEAAREAIAARSDEHLLLFAGDPIEFTVSTKPTVTIGAPRTRKAKKAPKAKPVASETPAQVAK